MMWFVIIVLDNAVYLFVWFFLSINGNGISFISVSVDKNASTGEQAGRERSGSTSGDELAALSHAHSKRVPTEGQKTGSEVQSERDIKVPGHCLVHNCFFFWCLDALLFYAYKLNVYVFTWRVYLSGNLKFEILYLGESRKVKIYCLSQLQCRVLISLTMKEALCTNFFCCKMMKLINL